MQDANYNVTGLINSAGTVQERYTYDPYGTASIFDNSWVTRASSSFAWNSLHQGLRYDGTMAKYYVRNREYDPQQGRWLTMDPLGFGAGDVNLYRVGSSNPSNHLDPSGLAQFKIGGYVFYVHKTDVDPKPSDPHAHINSKNTPMKVDLS